ncbi:hypothetical protein A6E15_11115 [Natrinema saccharevitans]|uniref:Uncharacterized protein n=1 Tax=Natrinema saccharevitans TaxID=301967 RepID=A0A1S8AY74_9EURY|nr:hypothetical protein [Natrinema saccharevitans]OLZ41501.1 hypothetical protein A6E15_11115 [Natrinema saccharevitans]
MERRRYLTVLGVLGTTGLAGCLSDDSRNSDDGNGTNDDDGSDTNAESNSDDEVPVSEVIDSYFEAAAAEDTEALAETVHTSSPLHPDGWEEDGWEFQGDRYEDIEDYDTEMVTADGSVDDIRKLEAAQFWFQETDLEEEIGSEDIALVDVEVDGLETDGPERWVLVTEDDEWRLFFRGVVDDTPDDPNEAFEEPIEDEDNDVVKEIDWDYEQEGGDGTPSDAEWARVDLTDSPGIDAETVRIESTIADTELEFYNDSEGELSTSWAGNWGAVELNPDGDQIVVTAVQNGTEEVVHREHYLPDEDG